MGLNGAQIIIKLSEHQGISRVAGIPSGADLPMEDKTHSRIWLMVAEDQQLDEVMRQTMKLGDVIDIRQLHGVDDRVFVQLEAAFN